MNLTYADLLKELQGLSVEQLQMNVSIYSPGDDEYYPVERVEITDEDDVLDKDHPVIHLSN